MINLVNIYQIGMPAKKAAADFAIDLQNRDVARFRYQSDDVGFSLGQNLSNRMCF